MVLQVRKSNVAGNHNHAWTDISVFNYLEDKVCLFQIIWFKYGPLEEYVFFLGKKLSYRSLSLKACVVNRNDDYSFKIL